jgi:hypothetical protein
LLTTGTISGLTMSGGSLVLDGGRATDVTISAGILNFAGSASLDGTLKFGVTGQLIIDSPDSPTATISGFSAEDRISFGQVYYSKTDTVTVNAPGVVTVSAGAETYNLNIAGATVGSTEFSLSEGNYGLVLTTTASPRTMPFLRPSVTAPVAYGQTIAEALVAPLAGMAAPAAPAMVTSAPILAPDWRPVVPQGGAETMIVLSHGGLFG